MTQLDKLRSMPVEEVAKGRLRYYNGFNGGQEFYEGDFGVVKVVSSGWAYYQGLRDEAYAEALRLEIAWLESEAIGETEGEK